MQALYVPSAGDPVDIVVSGSGSCSSVDCFHIPWALLVSFCHLSQPMCVTNPPPLLQDTPGKVHYGWCVLIAFHTPMCKSLDSDLKFSLFACLWCSTRHISFKFSPLNERRISAHQSKQESEMQKYFLVMITDTVCWVFALCQVLCLCPWHNHLVWSLQLCQDRESRASRGSLTCLH